MVANLVMIDADARADALALERLALWCLRQYSPIVAVDGADGVVMDTEGADHLHGGEEFMVSGLVNMLWHRGLTTRVAIADTWGASHALARLSDRETTIVPAGETTKAVLGLPIQALRLPADTVAGLGTMGFATVGELAATHRAPLALRFGNEVTRRIDQMFGRVPEVMEPLRTEEMVEASKVFGEPIAAADTIAKYIRRLSAELSARLEGRGYGMKRADLWVHRVDSNSQSIRVGLAKPARDPARISKLLCDRIDQIDPGFGIEKLTLTAVHTEPLEERQVSSSLIEEEVADVLPVIEVLANRGAKLYRVTPVASDVPERSFVRNTASGATPTSSLRNALGSIMNATPTNATMVPEMRTVVSRSPAKKCAKIAPKIGDVAARIDATPPASSFCAQAINVMGTKLLNNPRRTICHQVGIGTGSALENSSAPKTMPPIASRTAAMVIGPTCGRAISVKKKELPKRTARMKIVVHSRGFIKVLFCSVA
jgi:nucleotidyltransferase/DNA polymerase involved in DNA repair